MRKRECVGESGGGPEERERGWIRAGMEKHQAKVYNCRSFMCLHNGPRLPPPTCSIIGWVKPMGGKTLVAMQWWVQKDNGCSHQSIMLSEVSDLRGTFSWPLPLQSTLMHQTDPFLQACSRGIFHDSHGLSSLVETEKWLNKLQLQITIIVTIVDLGAATGTHFLPLFSTIYSRFPLSSATPMAQK